MGPRTRVLYLYHSLLSKLCGCFELLFRSNIGSKWAHATSPHTYPHRDHPFTYLAR